MYIRLIPGVIIFSLGRVLANDFIGRGYPEINTYLRNELFIYVMGSDMFVESYEIQIKLRQTLISKEARN